MNVYALWNEHRESECEEAFVQWQALQKETTVQPIGDGAYCGCMKGDHRGILLFHTKEDADRALPYESVGKTQLLEWDFVPYQAAQQSAG